MDILKIVAFGIVTAIIITTLRTLKPEIAIQASVVAGIIIFILVVESLHGNRFDKNLLGR